ncbi:hypothetical protein RRG08_007373 [Elysia crispata]|uniref:Oxidative stress-responsive serine-rich protein 1 n=1 Tax=Elysia crispata TaxID=231223 RepID=A0AAE1ARA3_9GAST|nr:hypothetical protein RRG08_007373 [Elysia crispata]
MGGEDRESGPSMSKSGSGKLLRHEDVSDAIISKLLKDFTSAELFPQSGDVNSSKTNTAKDDRAWNEVIESLKHLHVRHPGFKKHRRSKKPYQGRKGSPNLLNLAIAAGNLQKPIVWPARLNCDCEVENVRRLKQENEALRTGSITSNNRQQHPLFTGQQLFTNSPLRQPPSSDVLCSLGIPIQHLPPGANTSAPAIYAKPSTKTSLATAVPGAPYSSSSHRPFHHSMPVTTGQPASSSAGMGRSCSQEVRDMEDTNVNELASYLEDLLHIPRKMSTMAEMMYA